MFFIFMSEGCDISIKRGSWKGCGEMCKLLQMFFEIDMLVIRGVWIKKNFRILKKRTFEKNLKENEENSKIYYKFFRTMGEYGKKKRK